MCYLVMVEVPLAELGAAQIRRLKAMEAAVEAGRALPGREVAAGMVARGTVRGMTVVGAAGNGVAVLSTPNAYIR